MGDLDTSWSRGQRVGRYEILTRLSVGGMAEVFLAVVAGPGGFRKFVTIKRILPEMQDDKEFVRMFLDEARITAQENPTGSSSRSLMAKRSTRPKS